MKVEDIPVTVSVAIYSYTYLCFLNQKSSVTYFILKTCPILKVKGTVWFSTEQTHVCVQYCYLYVISIFIFLYSHIFLPWTVILRLWITWYPPSNSKFFYAIPEKKKSRSKIKKNEIKAKVKVKGRKNI